MRLRALEIQGFKSFPEKTRLTFDKPVTAIVGPNGSGKSNISDAILWVMGEQRTKTLRGEKMEDVIFGGTEKRSAMGFAQVSLILDNEDGALPLESPEVVLTRRYYRGGESEYHINKKSVRLRDVSELLMDTGLGREGYSIIGQGRIAEIVSAKSTERRQIFEEAAGISLYRHRKQESQRKLERTEENLLRIRDKIEELEMQVGPLEQQAEVAKQFLLYRDELRLLEVSVWMHTLDQLREQNHTVVSEYESAKRSLEETQKKLETLYAQAEQCAEKMRDCDLHTERARQTLREKESAAAGCENAIAVLQTRQKNHRESMARLEAEIAEQTGRTKGLEEQIGQQRQSIQALREQLHSGREQENALQRSLQETAAELAKAQAALEHRAATQAEISEKLAGDLTMQQVLADAAGELQSREAELEQARKSAGEHTEKAKAALAQQQEKLAQQQEKLAQKLREIEAGKNRRSAGEAEIQNLTDQQTRLAIRSGAVRSKLQMLTEMEKEYDGFSRAVKAVMRAAKRGALQGVHGPVAELVETEDRFTLAVETALGGALQNIVVSRAENGKQAIELLKKQDAGRSTFLPLESMRPWRLKQDLRGEPGYLGVAAELCRYAPEYEKLVFHLLGRTVITESLADAIRLGKKYDHGFRLVSLDGQVVNAGGSMTGGSHAKGTGFLSRANECRKLEQEAQTMAQQEKELAQRLEKAKAAAAQAAAALEELYAQQTGQQEQLHRQEAEVNQWRVLLENAQRSAESLHTESAALARRKQEQRERNTALAQEIADLRQRQAQLQTDAAAQQRQRERLLDVQRQQQEQLAAQRAKNASLEAERDAMTRSMTQLQSLCQELLQDSNSRRTAVEAVRSQQTELQAQQRQQEALLEQTRQACTDLQAQLTELAAKRLELEGARVRAEREGQETNRGLLDLERVCAGFSQKKLAAELEEKQLLDKLWDSYGLSHSVAQALRQPVESIQKANRRIAELKRGISDLGSPNLGAIAEFERVNTRYSFLKEQRDDVEKAKRDLTKLIGDITREMQEIFTREFQAIDASFCRIFRELFGGGRASLRLEEPENVLESGIEIKVQPPGKAISTISLMSGGEKAFVAIALYFAILVVRPTPFCVMDEIEAALDEANVSRYAEYMRKMSGRTQFIAITHRRGTMEEADMLYGVTMQEKGVSRVLAVDLEEAEKSVQG